MVDPNPDTLPTSSDLAGPCPRCGRVSNFQLDATNDLFQVGTQRGIGVLEKVSVLRCYGCRRAIVVVETRAKTIATFTPVMWWPTPGAGPLDESIPASVAKAYGEGARCLSIQVPNAAAAMLRSALAQVVQDQGSEVAKGKRSLNEALKQMVKDGSLHSTFEDWAGHIKDMGNAGAHPEVFGDVTQEEVEDLQSLVEQLLQFLYVQPARIARARAGRTGIPAARATSPST
jgi:hypothetical protein